MKIFAILFVLLMVLWIIRSQKKWQEWKKWKQWADYPMDKKTWDRLGCVFIVLLIAIFLLSMKFFNWIQ